MELLLIFGLGLAAYVLWKQSRGEQPSAGGLAGGCLGLGCLGLVLVSLAGVALLWLLVQALAGVDLSLSEFGDGNGQGDNPSQLPERQT